MDNNYKDNITAMVLVKQELMKLDKKELWSHHFPEVAATEKQVEDVESYLGYRLDNDYRSFLKLANGWKGFYQTVNLFGTYDLIGSSMMEYAKGILSSIEEDVLQDSGFLRDELLPIAATASDKDIFVMTSHKSSSLGIIIWFAGEEVDRFSSFEEYFLAMIDYNRKEIEDLKNEG